MTAPPAPTATTTRRRACWQTGLVVVACLVWRDWPAHRYGALDLRVAPTTGKGGGT